MAQQLFIETAEYISGHSVELKFNEGTVKRVDFEVFFNKHPHPQYNKYLKPINFKKFYLDHGNIVWGKNWDLIFPVEQLYTGDLG